MRAMAVATTVSDNNEGNCDGNEGEGGKAMAMVTRVAGKQR
jgi:hypothetical protein